MPRGFRFGDTEADIIGALRVRSGHVDPAAVLLQRRRATQARRDDRAGQRRHRAHAADLDRHVPVPGRPERRADLSRHLARGPGAQDAEGRRHRQRRRFAVGRARDDRHRARDRERQRRRTCCSCAARARRASSRCAPRSARGRGASPGRCWPRACCSPRVGGRRRTRARVRGAQGAARVSRRSSCRASHEIALDARSLAFALLVTLAAGAAISLAPVLRAARARLSTSLRAARGTSAGRAQHRAQNALVVGQVALALVLLVSSGLMIRTFEALRSRRARLRCAGVAADVPHRRRRPAEPRSRHVCVEQRAIVDGARGDSRRELRGIHECVADGAGRHAVGRHRGRRPETPSSSRRCAYSTHVAGLSRDDGHVARRGPRSDVGGSRRDCAP